MTRETPAGALKWIADPSIGPDVEAEHNEELARHVARTPAALRGLVPGCGLVLQGMTAWTADPAKVVQYAPKNGSCPGCGDVQPEPGRHCVICSADYRDATQRPMRDDKREAESRRHDLAGGTGPVKRRNRAG